ncbi:unknown protein [Parachlamydia acanthamoebae UV-7]|uniref:Uncharacterized protein n=1 Tax=Parachlamydia acanthamoebae (strain UV7) TaxID=765952 RepID=F8L2P4_PARAV|nr:unknown protein [Parachlamydia acanthamoebae UV-7]
MKCFLLTVYVATIEEFLLNINAVLVIGYAQGVRKKMNYGIIHIASIVHMYVSSEKN